MRNKARIKKIVGYISFVLMVAVFGDKVPAALQGMLLNI